MIRINKGDISKFDSCNMFDVILNFPAQVSEALSIAKDAPVFNTKPVSNDYMVLGMGGSAIGGDLLGSFLAANVYSEHISNRVNRGYDLPGSVNENTNIIASSYSGNTEETISAFEQAVKITKHIICITTGGELMARAEKYGIPVIKIPSGLQPRAALGYSFFPMLLLLQKFGAFKTGYEKEFEAGIQETLELLTNKSKIYSDSENEANKAIEIAEAIQNTIPVIYSAYQRLDAVNLRWRCQLNENSKQLAFGNLLPEMNHNEINAWSFPADLPERFSVIFMRDLDDHSRVATRFDALKTLIGDSVRQVIEIKGEGKTLLARIFDLIYLGDWVSFWLAMFNSTDPTPIPLISRLKNELLK